MTAVLDFAPESCIIQHKDKTAQNTLVSGVGMDAEILALNNRFMDIVVGDNLLVKLAFLILCILSISLLFISWYKKKKRNWDSFYFILLCLTVSIWSLFSFLALVFATSPYLPLYRFFQGLVWIYIPGFLCLHVWRQVSYKEITAKTLVAIFIVPIVATVIALRYEIFAYPDPFNLIRWTSLVVNIYAIVMIIRSYLLCFNVLYQMPRHMRKPTRRMLVGISMFTIYIALHIYLAFQPESNVLDGALNSVLLPLIATICAIVMMNSLYNAFYLAPAANVIATSREFVFGNLSTMILVLSGNLRILDWNKKGVDAAGQLPEPFYKEPFEKYRTRLLEESKGRISPHSNNIITTMSDGLENHYLITTNEIRHKKRRFGFLVEIAEITKVYSVLRTIEDSAMIDQLTGLYNRNAYISMVHSIVRLENLPLVVLVGDVNYLKRINDTLGHIAGDSLLKCVAAIIKDAMPKNAFATRIGGDEFVLLVPGGYEELAKGFIVDMNNKCSEVYDKTFGTPSISWGYSIMDSMNQEYNEVFAKADTMMYAYKKARFSFRSSGFVPSMDSASTPNESAKK